MKTKEAILQNIQNLTLPCDERGYTLSSQGVPVHFSNNPSLSYPNIKLPLTEKHIEEIYKCSQDIFYFVENYVQIFTLDDGWIIPELRDYQIGLLKHFTENRYCQVMAGRQSGKSITTILYILWKILFSPDCVVGIAANKESMATENLSRLKEFYENLPIWLKVGVKGWNKTYITLENGSKVYSAATSGNTFRGLGISILFVDEIAFIDVWDDFSKSVLPTISSGTKSQAIYTSTPKGINHFYTMWENAETKRSNFKNFRVEWWEVPGRDEKWREVMINTLPGGLIEFNQEYACEFLGSSKTLVEISMLKKMVSIDPIEYNKFIHGTRLYEYPKENHKYVLAADAAKDGADNYALHVLDITNFPFKQVMSGKFNVSHLSMPEVLNNIGHYYNEAFVIIENNEGGGQSNVDILYQVYEYINIFKEQKSYYGFRTTSKTRPKILSIMKMFVENGNLIIHDRSTIDQLFTFVEVNGKYQADKGAKDDIIMSLAISFAPYLNLTNLEDYKLFVKQLEVNRMEVEQEETETMGILSFGFFDDATDEYNNDKHSYSGFGEFDNFEYNTTTYVTYE